MAEQIDGATAAAGTAAGAASATPAGSPDNAGAISDASRAKLGLPLDQGPQDEGGASTTDAQGGPASAGQPSKGEPTQPTGAGAEADGPQTTDGNPKGDADAAPADDPEVIGLLSKWGLKVEAKATPEAAAGKAAGSGTPNNEAAQLQPIVAEIEKAIRGDGTVPLDQQIGKAVAMAAAGQQQLGKQGQELGVLRTLRNSLEEKGWFIGDEKGRIMPNIVPLAGALPPEEFARQIQSPEASEKLAAVGMKLVPLEADAESVARRFEEAAAAKLMPDKNGETRTHDERMAEINDDKDLSRRLNQMVTAAQVRADAEAGAWELHNHARLTQARQEVIAALDAMKTDTPELWARIGPAVMQHGKLLPASLNHQDGLAFTIGRAFYENREAIIRDGINLGYRLGTRKGQGDAGLLIGPGGGSGGGKAPTQSNPDGSLLSPESRNKLGLPAE